MLKPYFELLKAVPPLYLEKLENISEYYFSKVQDFNFTGHKTPETFFYLNILDSIQPFLDGIIKIQNNQYIADIGTGGGFPGVPLSVLNPNAEFTLVDSVEKKLKLIEDVATKNDLKNIRTVHTRLEEFGQKYKYREHFGVVTSKALAKWTTLLEYALPLLKVGGTLYAYQGEVVAENADTKVIDMLGGKYIKTHEYSLPGEYGKRYIIEIRKENPTPRDYPRKVGLPKENPL